MHVWTSAVCAAVGALVVASTGAAPAVLVLKLEIVALNNLRHGGERKRYFQLWCNFTMRDNSSEPVDGASAVNLPACICCSVLVKPVKCVPGTLTLTPLVTWFWPTQTNVRGETLYSD